MCTFLPAQGWSNDYALYILNSKNVVEGHDYNDTGFQYNPDAFTYSPASFPPPGLPVLLAPVYALFGVNFFAMKTVILIFYILFVAYTFIYLRKYYSDRTAFATAVLIGFSTGLWVLRDNIIGDFPAAVFILLTIVFLEKKKNIIDWKTSCTFALLIFINYVFRPTGLILFPA